MTAITPLAPRRSWYQRCFRPRVMLSVGLLLAGMLLAQGIYLNNRKVKIISQQMGKRINAWLCN